MAVCKGKTLTELYMSQSTVDVTEDDLMYIVDGKVSKAISIKQFLNFLFANGLVLGNATRKDISIIANIGNMNNPSIRYNASSNKWQISDDGINFIELTSLALPIATENSLGAIIPGKEFGITKSGVLSITGIAMNKIVGLEDSLDNTVSIDNLLSASNRLTITREGSNIIFDAAVQTDNNFTNAYKDKLEKSVNTIIRGNETTYTDITLSEGLLVDPNGVVTVDFPELNIVTLISTSSTDNEIPSAKAVKSYVDTTIDNVIEDTFKWKSIAEQ